MPLPVRSLPVLQNWDCHGCSDCCRTYAVPVSREERERIEAQGWDREPGFAGVDLFISVKGNTSLAHRPGGGCVFLNDDGRCRIHAKFGSAAKPLACRAYPFVLVPGGDHWRVGLRFTCPSVAENKGRPMGEHASDAAAYGAELEPRGRPAELPPPPLQSGQIVSWPDLHRITKAIGEIVSTPDVPMEHKLRHVLALARQLRKLVFDKVTGQRLSELLEMLTEASAEEVETNARVPVPRWVGRTVFRQLAAIHTRVDLGPNRGTMTESGWFGRMFAGYRFAWGGGVVPPVNGLLPAGVRFEDAERSAGPLPKESEELFARYFRVKLDSFQFAGAINFHLPYWTGLDSLVLIFPMALWLARLLTTAERPRAVAIREALRIVDDSYCFNALLKGKLAGGLRSLDIKAELPRLVAHYAR
jgi:lysine-N-methylase